MRKARPIQATEFEVSRTPDGEEIKLSFSDDEGNMAEAVIPLGGLHLLLKLLNQYKSGNAPQEYISKDELYPGVLIEVKSSHFRLSNDGGAVLEIGAHFPDLGRFVTIPLSLSSSDLQSLYKSIVDITAPNSSN